MTNEMNRDTFPRHPLDVQGDEAHVHDPVDPSDPISLERPSGAPTSALPNEPGYMNESGAAGSDPAAAEARATSVVHTLDRDERADPRRTSAGSVEDADGGAATGGGVGVAGGAVLGTGLAGPVGTVVGGAVGAVGGALLGDRVDQGTDDDTGDRSDESVVREEDHR